MVWPRRVLLTSSRESLLSSWAWQVALSGADLGGISSRAAPRGRKDRRRLRPPTREPRERACPSERRGAPPGWALWVSGLHLRQRGSLERAGEPGGLQTAQAGAPRPGPRGGVPEGPFEGGGRGRPGRALRRQPQLSAKWGAGRSPEGLPCTQGAVGRTRHLGEDGHSLSRALGRVTPAPQRARPRWQRLGWAARRRRLPRQGRWQGRPWDHMGGGRSRSPGRALPRVGQAAAAAAAAAGAAASPRPPSFLPFPPGPGRSARQVSRSQVRAPCLARGSLGAPLRARTLPPSAAPLSAASLAAGAPRGLGFPGSRRSSSRPWPAGTLASERRRPQNWESRDDGLGTCRRPPARSPLTGSKV